MNQPDCFPQAGDVENTGFMKNKKPESIDLQAFRLFHRPCGNCLTPCGKTVENSSVICIFSIFRIFSQLRKRKIRFEERIIHSNVFKRFILIFSGMSCILRKRNVHITVFIKGQEDAVPDTGHGQYLCCAATGDPGIFHDDFRTMKIMHWNEQTGFYGQNEVICSGLKHASLPWIDRKKGLFVIKPSGVEYDLLTPEDMVVVDLQGNKVEGKYNPSSDTATHVVLYNAFPKIGGIVHTHSTWATSWAQAGRDIPCYGTTHADYIYGEVPCVRNLTKEEIDEGYEKNTGVLIAEYFKEKDYQAVPAVLCKNHGPFTWGKDAHEAVHNAVVLEEVAKMACLCEQINPGVKPAPQVLQDKHYYRKHGANAYYGQNQQ